MNPIITLSTGVSIAFRGTILIAKSKKFETVKSIAKNISESTHHIAGIMKRLEKVGILKSLRGPKGGFELRLKPEDISFLDIYEAIEGKFQIEMWDEDSIQKKYMGEFSQKMNQDFINFLSSKKVADYL